MTLQRQLQTMLALFFLGVFTLVLWIPGGLLALWLSWRTGHPVARAGKQMFWWSWVFWGVAILVLPFGNTMMLLAALLITSWGGWLLYRSIVLWPQIEGDA
ncbi:hypothetical protein ACFOSD_01465 [Salinispirillum marinum]|uniref:Uncharacterized protein n=2 Tax=Saccharospirillaceae TaxID=255527 RepID=A0ABV8BAT3_9GAMM